MKFSSFRAACDSLAKFLLGGHAFASVFLRNDPVLSPQNPALVFRIEFKNLGDNGEKLRDTIIAPLKSAAPQMDDGMLAMRGIEVAAAVVIIGFGGLLLAGFMASEQIAGF